MAVSFWPTQTFKILWNLSCSRNVLTGFSQSSEKEKFKGNNPLLYYYSIGEEKTLMIQLSVPFISKKVRNSV